MAWGASRHADTTGWWKRAVGERVVPARAIEPAPPMEITLATPALLFPAITLLMLAYTNRFLGLASLIRNLHQRWTESHDVVLVAQIENLRRRLGLIRRMQALGVLSLLVCVACMFVL